MNRGKGAAPVRLGRYEVRAKIGEGGMASVYCGLARGSTNALVALKVIKDEFALNPEFVNMFLDEAKIVANLIHPNIVRLHELGTELTGAHRRLFLAMELLFGQSLWDTWDACRSRDLRLRYDVAAWIGARTADALHHAHDLAGADGRPLEVVHRDVNATNIFVTYDGQVKVIDFGLAKARNRMSRTAAGIIKGKTAYMSPEQAAGQPVDRRTDVFALGTTLWEITTDQRLFRRRDEMETLKCVHAAEVPDPRLLVEGYPEGLWRVLRKALARDPEARFATAGEMSAALDEYARADRRGPGSTAGAGEVAAVMHALFAAAKTEQAAWLREACAVDGPGPPSEMKQRSPGSFAALTLVEGGRAGGGRQQLATGAPAREDPADPRLFAPASRRPISVIEVRGVPRPEHAAILSPSPPPAALLADPSPGSLDASGPLAEREQRPTTAQANPLAVGAPPPVAPFDERRRISRAVRSSSVRPGDLGTNASTTTALHPPRDTLSRDASRERIPPQDARAERRRRPKGALVALGLAALLISAGLLAMEALAR